MVPGVNPGRRVVVHNNSLRNLVRGATERVLFVRDASGELVPPPRPSAATVERRLGLFRQRLRTRLPSITPLTPDEFAESYRGHKRLVYTKAVASLRLRPLTVRDAKILWFVKYEKIDATDKADPIPRLISPRDPRYNVMVGRYLKPAEPLLFKGIERVWGERVVAKGLNAEGVASLIKGKWQRFHNPVAVGLDASRFDQHVSREVMEHFEHRVYNDWFKSKTFRNHISWQLDNVCRGFVGDGEVRARVEGRRMSGDMNTSMGNCLIMCALVWAYARARGCRVSLVNNGDDCVVFLDRGQLKQFMSGLDSWFLGMGFKMTVEEPVYEIEKIEFCQAHPVAVGNGEYLMVRNLEASLAKDGITLAAVDHPKSVTSWCSSVGMGGTALCGGIPVLGEFYAAYARAGTVNPKWAKRYELAGRDFAAIGMDRRGLPILAETRASYYVAFGVLPDMQVAMESHWRNFCVPSGLPLEPSELFPEVHNVHTLAITYAKHDKLTC